MKFILLLLTVLALAGCGMRPIVIAAPTAAPTFLPIPPSTYNPYAIGAQQSGAISAWQRSMTQPPQPQPW